MQSKHIAIAAAALVCAVALTSCPTKEESSTPGPEDIVARVGSASFTDAQINEWLDWSKRIDSALAPAKVRRITLQDYLVPRAIGQGLAGSKQVERARERAAKFYRELVAAGGGLTAFRRLAEAQKVLVTEIDDYLRPFNQMPFDMSRAAFETSVGSHTGVLESTIGFCVMAVIDKKVEVYETRKVVTANFPYDEDARFAARVRKLTQEMLREDSWVHPLYREDFRSALRKLSEEWPPPAAAKTPAHPDSAQK